MHLKEKGLRREENTLFHMFINTYENHKVQKAFIYRLAEQEFEVSYAKLFDDVLVLARAFRAKKIEKGSKVMFLCDNRYEWMVTDMALVSLGAISIPRGCDTPTQELEFILTHSGADFLIVENEAMYERHETMLNTLSLKAIFIVEAPKVHSFLSNIYSYNDLLKDRTISDEEIKAFIGGKELLDEEDIFTLIYTSGTTGIPKGVVLTHKSLLSSAMRKGSSRTLYMIFLWVKTTPLGVPVVPDV